MLENAVKELDQGFHGLDELSDRITDRLRGK